MHDRIAELLGLRAELDNCENGPRRQTRAEAADQVREQITRVRGELAAEADRLDGEAVDFTEKGQDALAGQLTIQAREIRAALGGDAAAKPATRASGKRTTSAAKAPEQT